MPVAMILAAVVLAGCGSSTAGSPAGGQQPSAPTTGGSAVTVSADATTAGAVTALDLCSLVTAAQVSAVVGGTVALQDHQVDGKCDFTADERGVLTPTLDDMSAGGYDQARSGSSQLLTAGVKDLTGVGEHAFVATGEVVTYHTAQGAVAKGGKVVEVTFTSGSKSFEELSTMTEALLVIIAGNL